MLQASIRQYDTSTINDDLNILLCLCHLPYLLFSFARTFKPSNPPSAILDPSSQRALECGTSLLYSSPYRSESPEVEIVSDFTIFLYYDAH